MLKIEIRNSKSAVKRLAAGMLGMACAAAVAAPERIGPAFGPVMRIEHVRPASHFEFATNIYWYPRTVTVEYNAAGAKGLAEWMSVERQAGGLVMKAREDVMPGATLPGGAWFTLFRPIHGMGHPGRDMLEPSPVCFGSVRPAPMLPGEHFLASERVTWGANKLTYGYLRPRLDGGEEDAEFSATISRLTPGVMFEIESDMAIFFSDSPGSPRHLAWPDNGKIQCHAIPEGEMLALRKLPWRDAITKDMLDEMSDYYNEFDLNEPEWLLVWFGENGSYFYASRDARWLHDFLSEVTGEGHPIGTERKIKGTKGEGSTTEADMPFLFVFENPPVGFCAVEGGGIRFTFVGEAGRIVMHPLFGEDLPASCGDMGWQAGLTLNTRSWAGKLPDAVREKCEWWAKRLRQFPVDVEESVKYDDASDELTLTYRFEYEPVGAGGIKFAPIPPMLALAAKMGFPARLPQHFDPGYFTQVGPYIGVDNAGEYQIRMSGLGKYVNQTRAPGPGSCPESDKIEARLAREVGKMMEAGLLAPGLYHSYMDTVFQFRFGGSSFVWDRPGETIGCLSQTLDFLPSELRGQVLDYMKNEQAARPAETTVMSPTREGARREPYRLDTRMPKWRWREIMEAPDYREDILDLAEYLAQHNDRYLKEQIAPPDALYALAEYARRLPEAGIDWLAARRVMDACEARRDWATLGLVKRIPSRVCVAGWIRLQGKGRDASAVESANALMAGGIGLARLAKMFGDKSEVQEAYARFYLSAAHRFALETYGQWLYADGLLKLPENFKPDSIAQRYLMDIWVNWGRFVMNFTPETDPRSVHEMDEMRVAVGRDGVPLGGAAVPETGRFLDDLLGDSIRTRAEAMNISPDWFVWNSGGSGGKKRLGNSEYLFRAWIQGAPASELAGFIAAPWAAAGDLFYIQRLVEALYACRGVEWR